MKLYPTEKFKKQYQKLPNEDTGTDEKTAGFFAF